MDQACIRRLYGRSALGSAGRGIGQNMDRGVPTLDPVHGIEYGGVDNCRLAFGDRRGDSRRHEHGIEHNPVPVGYLVGSGNSSRQHE
jgi:hypothetical protein